METTTRAISSALCAALASSICLAPAPAVGQAPSDEEARSHFQAGTDRFQVADYEGAMREYREAFELSGRPGLMYNLYLCAERLGRLEEATRWLSRYLAEAHAVPRREVLVLRLRTMQERLAHEAAVGEELAPPSQPDPEPIDAPDPEPTTPRARPSAELLPAGIVLVSLGALAAGASLPTGLFAMDQSDQLARECRYGVCPGHLEGAHERAFQLAIATDALWIGGALLVTVGALLMLPVLLDDGDGDVVAGAACAPTGCALSVRTPL